jgi:UDP-N-acetylmuramoylalanine--D-glutamate ligase
MTATALDMTHAINTLIIGLGETGLSVARYLAGQGVAFAVADSRQVPPLLERFEAAYPDAPVYCGDFDAANFTGYGQLIVSPGVAVSEPAIRAAAGAGAEVLGDIELFARAAQAPVIAITGSNGKSTVTTLVGEMARKADLVVGMGGNLGTPALDLLSDEIELYVLELSSFQLETTQSLAPRAAVVLNVSPDHLDRYADVPAYAAAKGRIYHHAEHAIVNREDKVAAALAPASAVSFGLDAPTDGNYGVREADGESWLACGETLLLPARELRMAGRHNLANALAALALGEAAGLPRTIMLDTLKDFAGLPHRCERVAQIDGVDWINDSKGTNLGATLAALAGMPGKVVLLAGGLGKGQDFTPLQSALRRKGRALVLFGRDAGLIDAAVHGVVPTVHVGSLEAAVDAAASLAQRGDTVLLSPACASFDMFRGYEQRGEMFMELVRRRVQ